MFHFLQWALINNDRRSWGVRHVFLVTFVIFHQPTRSCIFFYFQIALCWSYFPSYPPQNHPVSCLNEMIWGSAWTLNQRRHTERETTTIGKGYDFQEPAVTGWIAPEITSWYCELWVGTCVVSPFSEDPTDMLIHVLPSSVGWAECQPLGLSFYSMKDRHEMRWQEVSRQWGKRAKEFKATVSPIPTHRIITAARREMQLKWESKRMQLLCWEV